MKSLEHIIREIRQGKVEKGNKKSLEGAIRNVMKGEKESSFADRTTKPITDDVGGLIGSGTGGEPKLHKEAVGVIGTDDYQGNQFKSVRTTTPHIKPPAGPDGHSQAPENVSRQRTLAKEKGSMTLHGKVSEQVVPAVRLAAPVIGAGVTAGLGAAAAGKSAGETLKAAVKGGVGKIQRYGSYFDKLINPPAEDIEKAKQKIKAAEFKPVETPTKPKHDEPVPAGPGQPTPVKEPIGVPKPKFPDATPGKEKVKPPKPDIGQPDAPKPTTVPRKEPVEIPQEPPAKAVPAPEAPKPGVEIPSPYRVQPAKEKEKPVETPGQQPAPKRWKEVGPPMPAETKPKEEPARAPVKLPDINIPGTKVKPAAEPDTKVQPDTKTKPETKVEPRVVQLPAIDIGARTKTATDTKVAPSTAAAETPAATTPKSAETTTTGEADKKKLPSFGGASIPHAIDYTASHLVRPKVGVGHAKMHKKHAMRESEDRKTIENMPRKGDRKSIEYVGRSNSNPKTTREKTSRLAIIKNVIDEAKKQVAKKTSYEDGKTKMFDYGDDVLIINPNQKRIDLDVEGNKLPKDYDNK